MTVMEGGEVEEGGEEEDLVDDRLAVCYLNLKSSPLMLRCTIAGGDGEEGDGGGFGRKSFGGDGESGEQGQCSDGAVACHREPECGCVLNCRGTEEAGILCSSPTPRGGR